MRLIAPFLAAGLLAAPALAETKEFRDWVAGCDNLRTCTAIGLVAEDSYPLGYVRISRGGAGGAKAEVRLVVTTEAGEGKAGLKVTLDGKPFAGGTFDARSDGSYVIVDLGAADAAAFVAAVPNAKSLKLQRADATEEAVNVSLSGSSASLRYLDAEQKRDGGVTALVAKGNKPASDVPPPPAAPVVKGSPVRSLETLPAAPKDLPKANPDDCFNMEETRFAVDLGDRHTLWGVCYGTGAYNYAYGLYIADAKGKVKPVKPQPGNQIDEDVLVLVNPYAPDGGKTIEAFNKGRGLGDCGDEAAYAWNGQELVLVRNTEMITCRGVSSEDWIGTYQAVVK